MSTMMLNFLEADRTWSYRHVNSPQGFDPNAESHPGRDYFEALIAGSFSLDDVEEIKIPDYAFGRFALTGTDLEDERKKLLPTDKLRDLGFTEAEIQYLYSLIGTNDFPADAAVHNLIEYRAMKRKKEQIEALGPKVVVTTYKGTDMFSPTTYGAQTSEEIESILEKRIYDTVLKETKRKMAPRRPIDPEDEM